MNSSSYSYSKYDKEKWIMGAKPSATIALINIQLGESKDREEGECLFHSQMWVKGTPLRFIVENGNQKNLIQPRSSRDLVSNNGTPSTIHYWLVEPCTRDMYQQAMSPSHGIKPFKYEVLCDAPHSKFVILFQEKLICENFMMFMGHVHIVSLLLYRVISTEYQR